MHPWADVRSVWFPHAGVVFLSNNASSSWLCLLFCCSIMMPEHGSTSLWLGLAEFVELSSALLPLLSFLFSLFIKIMCWGYFTGRGLWLTLGSNRILLKFKNYFCLNLIFLKYFCYISKHTLKDKDVISSNSTPPEFFSINSLKQAHKDNQLVSQSPIDCCLLKWKFWNFFRF